MGARSIARGAPVPSARVIIGTPAPAPGSLMYSTERLSQVHAARVCTVSPNVMRENGPEGSCLTQMSCAAPFTRETAIDLPSGARATVVMLPSGIQVESTGEAAPLRVTHHALVAAALPPAV